ncbi:MAG TPA: secretin N-terminal domain-containing protein, partial [Nitrospirota bacterium]
MATISRAVAVVLTVILLAGCSGSMAFKRGEKYAVEGDWDRAVTEYRQALRDDPENVAYKTRLTKAVDMAATTHIERANYYLREKNASAALYEAQQAVMFSPGNNKAGQLVDAAMRMAEVDRRMTAGRNYLAAGRPNDALNQYYKVLDIDQSNEDAKKEIERITRRKMESEKDQDALSLASDQPITLSFKDAKLKDVFEFLSKLSGVSIVFDEDVKDSKVTVFAKDVSFNQALDLMLATNKLFMKKIAADAIIVIPKTKAKLDQYQDLKIKTFYLSNTKAKDMVNIIRTMLETRKVIINESLNSITLREVPEKIELAEKLIEANDMKDAEVVIDVEVLAVERGDTVNLGISLPKGVEATYFPGGVAPAAGGTTSAFANIVSNITTFKDGLSNYKDNVWFSYPSVTADWSKIRSKGETLTNPQIRSLNNQPAKILIGSRVPIQTGTSVSTVTTTTFEYREIGIKLNVEPDISLANDITLKTTLEVSSLG